MLNCTYSEFWAATAAQEADIALHHRARAKEARNEHVRGYHLREADVAEANASYYKELAKGVKDG